MCICHVIEKMCDAMCEVLDHEGNDKVNTIIIWDFNRAKGEGYEPKITEAHFYIVYEK